jgi:hypothetical protein
LLASQLTDAEIQAVADELASSGDPGSAGAIHKALTAATDSKPLGVDVARVRARLAAGGWPLAAPGSAGPD